MTSAAELAGALRSGDRRALAKAITLVESSRTVDRAAARELLSMLGAARAGTRRIGVTGVPGAGKSTRIDALGREAILEWGQCARRQDTHVAFGGGAIRVRASQPDARVLGGDCGSNARSDHIVRSRRL